MTARRMHIAQEWPVVVFGGGSAAGRPAGHGRRRVIVICFCYCLISMRASAYEYGRITEIRNNHLHLRALASKEQVIISVIRG